MNNDIQAILERTKLLHSQFKDKTILLTGSNGFLGQYFRRILFRFDCRIIMIDNLIVPNQIDEFSGLEPEITFIQHDITKPFKTNEKIDYIINCAGVASPFWYNKFPLETLHLGIEGLENMLKLSVEHKARLLYFSSSEVYGTPDAANIPTKETYVGQIQTMGERSCYDVSKLVGETLCHIYNTRFGADAVICRPFNFYGSLMSNNDERVLPAFRQHIRNNEMLKINSGGSQTRSFCHIIDAIDGCLRVLVNGITNRAYNIGNPSTETTINGLVKTIEKVLNKELWVLYDKTPAVYEVEPLRRCPDIMRAKNELGFEPSVGLEEGLARFFDV